MLRALASVLLAALLLGAGAAPASAHATLLSSDPAEGEVLASSPGEVTFTFDEPVSLVADGVRVFDATGEPVPAPAVARDDVVTADVPDDLADGTYVVTWRIVSADGHPVAGSLTFSVGAPSETVAPPKVGSTGGDPVVQAVLGVVQGVGYAALLLAGGLLFFGVWTVRGLRLHDDVRRRITRIARVAAVVAVGSAALQVPLAGAYQQGLGLSGLVDPASYGWSLVSGRVAVLLCHAVGLALALRLSDRGGPLELAGWLGGLFAVWSPALVGHTRAYEPSALLVITDALHLSAGAVWLGGLVGLVLVLRALVTRERDAAVLLSRFTAVAAALLGVLVLTGVLLAWRILGSWELLVDTAYGRLLLAKVGIAAVVAGVAAWNRFRLVPQMGRPGHDGRRRAATMLRRTVAGEAALLVVVLVVTGVLVQQAPTVAGVGSGAAAATTDAVTVVVEDHRIVVVLDAAPGRQRAVIVQVQDETGEPLDVHGTPVLSLSSPDVDLGQVPLEPVASGTFRADVVFPALGPWEAQVSLPVDRFTNPVTTLELDVE